MLGQNYRPEWTTPVNMKVFNINKERGGFTANWPGRWQANTNHYI